MVWFAGRHQEKALQGPFGTVALLRTYRGQSFDAETGLVYLRNRYYEPSLGTFTQVDPARAGHNWFGYAGGDPVNRWDPSGLDWIFVHKSDNRASAKKSKGRGWPNRAHPDHVWVWDGKWDGQDASLDDMDEWVRKEPPRWYGQPGMKLDKEWYELNTFVNMFFVSRQFGSSDAAKHKEYAEKWKKNGMFFSRPSHGYIWMEWEIVAFRNPSRPGTRTSSSNAVFTVPPLENFIAMGRNDYKGALDSWSWHPNTWYPDAISSNLTRPARVWRRDPQDLEFENKNLPTGKKDSSGNPLFEPMAHEKKKVTTMRIDKYRGFVAHVQKYINDNSIGFEEGPHKKDADVHSTNTVGSILSIRRPLAKQQYWVTGQNCFWWMIHITKDWGGEELITSDVKDWYRKFNRIYTKDAFGIMRARSVGPDLQFATTEELLNAVP